jgi:hypothetical protein
MNIEVVASSATAQIEGSVIDGNDQVRANATVVAIPRQNERGIPEHYRTTLTDQHGRFQIPGLHPDDYTVLAWEDVENGAWCDPDFVKAFESSGERVHLAENGRKNLTVKLIPAPNQGN